MGPAVLVSSGGGGGGSAPVRHTAYMCSPDTGKCANVYPTVGSDQYQVYYDCYYKEYRDGSQCSIEWALANGYVTPENFDPENPTQASAAVETESAIDPEEESSVEDEAATQTDVEEEYVPTRTPVVSPPVIDPACAPQSFARRVSHRGTGLPAGVFTDLPVGHQAYRYLVDIAEQDIAHGDSGTHNARVDDAVSRAEVTKILSRAAENAVQTGCLDQLANSFNDLEFGSWYHPYVLNQQKRGIVHGYQNGTFRPGQSVNKIEFIKMAAITFGFITKAEADNISNQFDLPWYQPYYNTLEQKQLLPDWFNQYGVDHQLSRGDVFALVAKILAYTDGVTID